VSEPLSADGAPSSAAGFPSVTVCLLNFNGGAYVRACLDSVLRSKPGPTELVVVDNASSDGSAEWLRHRVDGLGDGVPVRFVRLDRNRGYAGGHNAGARVAHGEFLAFLNVTTEVEPAWLVPAEGMRARPEVAFLQPPILDYEERERIETLGALMSPRGRIEVIGRNRRYDDLRVSSALLVFDIFSVRGAAFLARADRFRALGGFDESMFMYFEESDLCWRGWQRGWRTVGWIDPRVPGRVFHRTHGTVPASFEIDRRFGRNRTLSLVRNLERRAALRVGLNVLDEAGHMTRSPSVLGRYLGDVAKGLPAALRARPALRAERTASDRTPFELRVPPELADALARARELPERAPARSGQPRKLASPDPSSAANARTAER
jgi:GT2 family glycosyltransferase